MFSKDVRINYNNTADRIVKKIALPVIVKPVHFGSSIAINVAKKKVELKKYLLEASYVDSEILVEEYIKNFSEYNVSVRSEGGRLETSEIEKPMSKDEILSFADKYQRGNKKSGGMASLARDLPANIPDELTKRIKDLAVEVFKVIRAKGLIRVDFMVKNKAIYVIEVNPIPGSM